MSINKDLNNKALELIDLLAHKSSPKRRSAAKKLRKLNVTKVSNDILEALKKELKDRRTWETQYQIIMALGESKNIQVLDYLIDLSKRHFEASILYLAIGDAITTLELSIYQQPVSLMEWITNNKSNLINGALRSLAMHQTVLNNNLIQKIIKYISNPTNPELEFWAIAAMPGWPLKNTKDFLKNATLSSNSDIKKAAISALKGKYLKWNPL